MSRGVAEEPRAGRNLNAGSKTVEKDRIERPILLFLFGEAD